MNIRKVLIPALAMIIGMSMFAGCSRKESVSIAKAASASTTDAAAKKTAQVAESAAAAAASAQIKILTVYSSHEADIINIGVKEFQEKTGIKVDTVAAGTGELLKRIESESGNPLGDVMWGGGADSLSAFSRYFEKYASPEAAGFDPEYVDVNGFWSGESPLPMIIMYNKNLVAEKDVPASWADLLDAKWKGKIAYADPNKSGSAYTILCTLLTCFGRDDGKGWDFVKKFYANLDGKLSGSSSAVFKGVADGEYALGLTLEEQAAKYMKAGAPVGIVYPAEGTSALPDGICIIKGAKNIQNAKLFVDFVISRECQSIFATQLNRRPVRSDVAPPAGMVPLNELKLIDYDSVWASGRKEANLAKFKEIMVGKE